MKVILVLPPFILNNSPAAGIACLSGMLKKLGHEVVCYDLNAEFYKYIFSYKFLDKAIQAKKKLSVNINSILYKKTHHTELTISEKNIFDIWNKIIKSNLEYIKENLNDILKIYSSEVDFYNLPKWKKETKIIEAYSNNIFSISDYIFNFEQIDEDLDLFRDFYQSAVEKILEYNADCIGISNIDRNQLTIGKNIAKILRKRTKKYIVIGGSDVTFHKEDYVEALGESVDSIIYGDGEYPFIQLLNYIEGKVPIEEVLSLTYLDSKGEIKCNPVCKKAYKEYFNWHFEDFDLDNYFSISRVLPVESSRSCYWNNCAFCNFNEGNVFKQKSAGRLISEIKFLIKKYEVNIFQFVDSCVSPRFLKEFSEKILEENIEIYYSVLTRCEKIYTKELLQNLYDSGLRACFWGLESGSEKILNVMNKGTDIETTKRILKDAHDIGITNCGFSIVNLPTETDEDLEQTVKFMKNKNLDSIIVSPFFLAEGSKIENHPEEFGLTKNNKVNSEVSFYGDVTPEKKHIAAIKEISEFVMSDTWLPSTRYFTETLLYSIKKSKNYFKN